METIERTACAITKEEDLEPLYTFKDFPIYMGCTDQDINSDLYSDMNWSISRKAGAIQLKDLIPLDVLYPESHGSGSVGPLWRKHHHCFCEFIKKYSPKSVFEIGGQHGVLANDYIKQNNIPWTILEPNPTPTENNKAIFIKGFFDHNYKIDPKIDAIVHSHVFEHMYDPDDFMNNLSNSMDDNKLLFISIPNLYEHLKRKFTFFIGFEHSILLNEVYAEYFLKKYGFKVIEKEYFLEDHSIFYATIKDSSCAESAPEIPPNIYLETKKLYENYIFYHVELVMNINNKIDNCDDPVFLFGAHANTQYLLSFGLNKNRITCVLDNDRNKQGRRLYGTKFKVESPNILKNYNNPIVVLRSGVFNDEIIEDIKNNINPDTVFLCE